MTIPKTISKRQLKKFIKQNKSTRFIAGYFQISERTTYRRIRKYGLKNIRPKGRKPFVRKPEPPVKKKEWIPTIGYIDCLNQTYHFQNINYPRSRYINPKTRVCSNRKGNPKGKFTTIGVYFIALASDVYFIYRIGIRYSEKPVSFRQIYKWAKNNAYDLIVEKMELTDIFVEDLVGFTFYEATTKPNDVKRE